MTPAAAQLRWFGCSSIPTRRMPIIGFAFLTLLCVTLVGVIALISGSQAAAQSPGSILVPDVEIQDYLDKASGNAHPFWVPQGTEITLTMRSEALDAYLVLLDPNGQLVIQDDDGAGGTGARITFRTEVAGWHRAVALAYAGRGVGSYSLTLTLGAHVATGGIDPPEPDPNPADDPSPSGSLNVSLLPTVEPGEWISGELEAEPVRLTGSEGINAYAFQGEAGQRVWIRMIGDLDLDPYLRLTYPDGRIIAEEDDGYWGTDTQIVTVLPETGTYVIHTGAFGGHDGGEPFYLRWDEIHNLQIEYGTLTPGADDDGGQITESPLWHPEPDHVAFVWLRSNDFDAVLNLRTEDGALLLTDDDSGGGLNALIVFETEGIDSLQLEAASFSDEPSGSYELHYWSVPADIAQDPLLRLDPQSIEAPVESKQPMQAELLASELVSGRLEPESEGVVYTVEVPEDADDAVDVWVFSDHDLDVEVYGLAGADALRSPGELLGETYEPSGYEHVQVSLPNGTQALRIKLTGWMLESSAPYSLYAEFTSSGSAAVPSWFDSTSQEPPSPTGPLGGRLHPGESRSGRLNPSLSATQTWVVDVPTGVTALHLGLDEAQSDLDLSISPGFDPRPFGETHLKRSESLRYNERFTLTAPDGESLEPGIYTVAVWSSVVDVPINYEILVTFDQPLPPLTRLAPTPTSGLHDLPPHRRAALATVEVTGWHASGSGSLVTPDGLILTNYHVIAPCPPLESIPGGCEDEGTFSDDAIGDEEEWTNEIIISLTEEERGFAVQAYVARVVETQPQYDLALLQVISDLEGNPLSGLSLPFLTIDVRPSGVALGQEVLAIGYPGVAQMGAQTPISLTRGIVSGFTEWESERIFLQIDANIAGGNSGGALVRSQDGVLIGTPSDRTVTTDSFESQSFARPTSLLPDTWLELLGARGAVLITE